MTIVLIIAAAWLLVDAIIILALMLQAWREGPHA